MSAKETQISSAEIYKGHIINVYKDDDPSIAVEVNNNSFVMPEYSVIVDVEFERIYNIKYSLINLTSNGSLETDGLSDYKTKLISNTGYKLPDTIAIKIGESYLSNEYYTYDKTTGNIVISKSAITDDIEIIATGIKEDNIITDKEEINNDISKENEINPQTSDNIIIYILIGLISFVCLLGTMMYFKKETK